MTRIIDGKAFAAELRTRVATAVSSLESSHGLIPGLAVVLVGEDPASEVYVRNKGKQTVEVGMASFEHRLSDQTTEGDLLLLIDQLNSDPTVHGILVQLPLPAQINTHAVINAIDPDKDVDGFHLINVGRLTTGESGLVPCTPLGCMMLLREYAGDLSGQNAVIVGRSNIVGKPMALLLSQTFKKGNATVTICHSRTTFLEEYTSKADILIAAAGVPKLITASMVNENVDIIDVGINRVEDNSEKGYHICGDVDFEGCLEKVNSITPVPGGVGPMTIVMLLLNTIKSAENANK